MEKLLALSVRQPWAWLIIHAGKDIENRTWASTRRGKHLIHASSAPCDPPALILPHIEEELGIRLPEYPAEFRFGGVIGHVEIVDCVTRHHSRWFEGPHGFVLANPTPLPFGRCPGRLGFFAPDTDVGGQQSLT